MYLCAVQMKWSRCRPGFQDLNSQCIHDIAALFQKFWPPERVMGYQLPMLLKDIELIVPSYHIVGRGTYSVSLFCENGKHLNLLRDCHDSYLLFEFS